jgi:hypothetical protein
MTRSHKIIQIREEMIEILVLSQNCVFFNGVMRKPVLEEVCRTVLSVSCSPEFTQLSHVTSMSLVEQKKVRCQPLSLHDDCTGTRVVTMNWSKSSIYMSWQRHTCTCLNNKWKNFVHAPSNHPSISLSLKATTSFWPRHIDLNLLKAGGNHLLVSPPIF